ncbi:MAG: monovalent cation/H(+) antiporter subunit G [Lachnospiraceae bacterium]|nr:monovalent cation/H(+) antiporter subunit G [Lachnospiraceae bacterium]
MEILLWLRFIIGTLFLLAGMGIFVVEIISVFKLKYVLDRMHAAATGDTFGLGLSVLGLTILSGLNLMTLKLLLIVVFLWCASPVSSHLIAKLEVFTHEGEDKYGKVEIE